MAQRYADLYQNWCDDFPLTWDKLLYIVDNPSEHLDKMLIPLWSFYHLVDNPKTTWNGPLAIGKNMESIYALIIDYDDGVIKMSDLPQIFSCKYVAYSSPSNSYEKEKFRVIVPLKQAVPNRLFKCPSVRNFLNEKFKGCDHSTFDYFRRQRVPSKLPETVYHTSVGVGENMGLDTLQMENIYNAWLLELEEKRSKHLQKRTVSKSIFAKSIGDIEADGYIESLKEKYKLELSSLKVWDRGHGIVHETFRRIVYALRKSYMEQDEIFEFMDRYTPMGITSEIESLIYGEIYE